MRVNISVREADTSVWNQAAEVARMRGVSMSALILDCLRRAVAEHAACTNCHGQPPVGFVCRTCGTG